MVFPCAMTLDQGLCCYIYTYIYPWTRSNSHKYTQICTCIDMDIYVYIFFFRTPKYRIWMIHHQRVTYNHPLKCLHPDSPSLYRNVYVSPVRTCINLILYIFMFIYLFLLQFFQKYSFEFFFYIKKIFFECGYILKTQLK